MSRKLRCNHCQEVIGVYEPLILVVRCEARETSRAAEPSLGSEDAEHYHAACYAERLGVPGGGA